MGFQKLAPLLCLGFNTEITDLISITQVAGSVLWGGFCIQDQDQGILTEEVGRKRPTREGN